jgi:hypothetical protein
VEEDLIDKGPNGDLESDLRVALLACWSGGDRKLAMDFLKQSASHQLESIELREGRSQGITLDLWPNRIRSFFPLLQLL